MRTWVLDRAAEADLQAQIDYLIDRGAITAAEKLAARVRSFLGSYLTAYPKTGTPLHHRDLWETWVPGTRLVLWYRFTDTELQVARIWHTSRKRSHPGDVAADC